MMDDATSGGTIYNFSNMIPNTDEWLQIKSSITTMQSPVHAIIKTHNIANTMNTINANANAYAKFIATEKGNSYSEHFIVSETQIFQCIPIRHMSNHGGQEPRRSISIMIWHGDKGMANAMFTQAMRNAARLLNGLIRNGDVGQVHFSAGTGTGPFFVALSGNANQQTFRKLIVDSSPMNVTNVIRTVRVEKTTVTNSKDNTTMDTWSYDPASGQHLNPNTVIYNPASSSNSSHDGLTTSSGDLVHRNQLQYMTAEGDHSGMSDDPAENMYGQYGLDHDDNTWRQYNNSGIFDLSTLDFSRTGILGLPFQFNALADGRHAYFGSKQIGRVFERNIWMDMPICMFEIGIPGFFHNTKGKNSDKNNVFDTLKALSNNDRDVALDIASGHSPKNYYRFEPNFKAFEDYVNTMARFVAHKMGIGQETMPQFRDGGSGKTYGEFILSAVRNDRMLVGSRQAQLDSWQVPIYINPETTSFSESGENTTGESQVAGLFHQASALKREFDFLFGRTKTEEKDKLEELNDKLNNVMGEGGHLKSMFSRMTTTIATGAKMLFPEVWQDSQYRKSVNIGMVFNSPYGDPESIFWNIYIPYIIVVCMSMPRHSSVSGYVSPFILRAFYKGWFNIDCGMVESITIKKGGRNNTEWTIDGLPTEIEIELTIRDLYPTMLMTANKNSGVLFNTNTALVAYLNTMAGVNILYIEPLANLSVIYHMLKANLSTSIFHTIRGPQNFYYKTINRFIRSWNGMNG